MKSLGVAKSFLGACLLLFTVDAAGGPEASSPRSFSVAPVNPAAEQAVRFADDPSRDAPTGWHWDFGDGQTSNSPASSHTYANPGLYSVRLRVTTVSGARQEVYRQVDVSPAGTLRLNPAHPFDVTLLATDPITGRTFEGKAIGQGENYGYFAIRALGSAQEPEVVVKVDEGGANGRFPVHHVALTDLEYTLTVTENATGIERKYGRDSGASRGRLAAEQQCGDPRLVEFRTSQQTQPPAATATPPAPEPTSTPPAPTPTPGSGTIVVGLVAQQFEWNFNDGGPNFQMQVGQTYEVRISTADVQHGFGGIPSLGMNGANLNPGDTVTRTVQPTASQVGTHPFACSVSSCGVGHDGMVASIQVVP